MVEVDLCVQIGPSDRYSHVVFFLLWGCAWIHHTVHTVWAISNWGLMSSLAGATWESEWRIALTCHKWYPSAFLACGWDSRILGYWAEGSKLVLHVETN
jgi:hypothetical protein